MKTSTATIVSSIIVSIAAIFIFNPDIFPKLNRSFYCHADTIADTPMVHLKYKRFLNTGVIVRGLQSEEVKVKENGGIIKTVFPSSIFNKSGKTAMMQINEFTGAFSVIEVVGEQSFNVKPGSLYPLYQIGKCREF